MFVDIECTSPNPSNPDSEKSGSTMGIIKVGIEDTTYLAPDVSLPMNWPMKKKVFNMAIPALLCFVV